jgi:uncharacterized protein YkwD
MAATASAPAPSVWNTAVIALINSERKTSKVAAVTLNADLAKAAAAHSKNMATYNKLESRTPNEDTVPNQIRVTGYKLTYWGANYGSYAGGPRT